MARVTQRRAERVLASLKAAYAEYLKPLTDDDGKVISQGWPEPVLVQDYQTWSGGHAPYAILWEEGPHEWTYALDGSPTEEERVLVAEAGAEFGKPGLKAKGRPAVVAPAGVFIEPLNSWSVGIYPA